MKKIKIRYYSLSKILAYKAIYNVIFGERTNGKTYACLKYAVEQWVNNGRQTALVRRWDEDYRGKRGVQMFSNLVNNNEIARITNGEWTGVKYYSSRWYLTKQVMNDDGSVSVVVQEDPFCYGFSLTAEEHDKSTSYPRINTVIFDEFISRKGYLPDEFVIFQNVLSTIIRERDDVTIFMIGNSLSKYCPYFNEMGLKHVKQQKQGTIDLYTYGDSGLSVAVEYCEEQPSKPSSKYFAFDNSKLKMITSGAWEIAVYPHLPRKYIPKDVIYTFFIEYEGETLQAEVIQQSEVRFIFIHRKTTPIRQPDTDMVYTPIYSERPNYFRRITEPVTKAQQKICELFKQDKVFYQDNNVGEIVRNYLMWCNT